VRQPGSKNTKTTTRQLQRKGFAVVVIGLGGTTVFTRLQACTAPLSPFFPPADQHSLLQTVTRHSHYRLTTNCLLRATSQTRLLCTCPGARIHHSRPLCALHKRGPLSRGRCSGALTGPLGERAARAAVVTSPARQGQVASVVASSHGHGGCCSRSHRSTRRWPLPRQPSRWRRPTQRR
jgi:hypothetical protein